jgi:hypothetical protein
MAMPSMPSPRKTPIGVLILGILTILSGLGLVAIGGLLAVAAFITAGAGGPIGGMFGALFGIIAVLILIFGIIAILSGVGLIRLRPWAWWLTMIVSVLSLLSSLADISTLWYFTILELVIIIYLVIVKKHFGARPAGM